jgi:hypothetical protein
MVNPWIPFGPWVMAYSIHEYFNLLSTIVAPSSNTIAQLLPSARMIENALTAIKALEFYYL